MRGLKKFITGILAGAMALSMTLSTGSAMQAKAEGESGSITVSNTTQGETYKIYKVFDATYASGSGDDVNVAYTYDGSKQAFLDALKSSDSPFSIPTTQTQAPYNVSAKEGATGETIAKFLKDNEANLKFVAGTDGNGNGGDLKFSGLDYGYYYITSSVGAVVSINSAIPSQTVIDKNQDSTIDKLESVDGGSTWAYKGAYEETTTIPTVKVGDTVNYKVTGCLTKYIGEEEVDHFTFTDTMDSGLTRNSDVKVEFGDGVAENGSITNVSDVTGSCTIVPDGQTVTITIPKTALSSAKVYYQITYSGIVNENAIVTTTQNNNVTLKYNDTHDIGSDKTSVINYMVTLTKRAGSETGDVLAGAKFALYGSAESDTKIKVVLVSGEGYGDGTAESENDNVYRVAKADETAIEEMVTGKTGVLVVKGLNNGDYYFEETEAPSGYNKLTDRQKVQPITGKTYSIDNADNAIPVVNNAGVQLPSTGGIGTTIFYIIGGLLIVAAVVFFVLRRKNED